MSNSTLIKARDNRIKVLKAINRFGWLRSRDLALIVWTRWNRPNGLKAFNLVSPARATQSKVRLAQKTLKNMREEGLLLNVIALDGSVLYTLSSRGAQALAHSGIDAQSGKNLLRKYSLGYLQHRCISNEIAVTAMLAGYKVSTEREIAGGKWLGGKDGFLGKLPDVFVRSKDSAMWIEVERSRKNQRDYLKLLDWIVLVRSWLIDRPYDQHSEFPIFKIMFICTTAFKNRLISDLTLKGFTTEEINSTILFKDSLYRLEAIGII